MGTPVRTAWFVGISTLAFIAVHPGPSLARFDGLSDKPSESAPSESAPVAQAPVTKEPIAETSKGTEPATMSEQATAPIDDKVTEEKAASAQADTEKAEKAETATESEKTASAPEPKNEIAGENPTGTIPSNAPAIETARPADPPVTLPSVPSQETVETPASEPSKTEVVQRPPLNEALRVALEAFTDSKAPLTT